VDIIADIGATHSRCALVDYEGRVLAAEKFDNAEYESLEKLLQAYLQRRRATDQPSRAAIAVAAPILSDQIQMTNLAWSFSQLGLQASMRLRRLFVVNDFEALAWGLADFDADSRAQIGGGQSAEHSPFGVLGPGSGLGVASLIPVLDGWQAIAGEGGHVTLPASTSEQAEIIEIIRERHEHCSAERVLSGPGLVNLYEAVLQISGEKRPTVQAADVTSSAQRGDPLASKALSLFFDFLGTVAGDLALTIGARGGIYIAGGIVPRVLEVMRQSRFRKRFESKGRYRSYLSEIPTFVITEPIPAFRGLRHVLGYK
jgi:glucokinase